jgi:hypothetical protein
MPAMPFTARPYSGGWPSAVTLVARMSRSITIDSALRTRTSLNSGSWLFNV